MEVTEDVYAIASRYLHKVKRSGPENIMAACPFHTGKHGGTESTPSFTMSLTRGLYLCFSCKASGTLKKFLEEIGIAPLVLENQYGVVLKELENRPRVEHDPLRPNVLQNEPLPEALLGLFQYIPEELEKEGFTEETLNYFDVGVDKLHSRITYPLRDWRGNLVGISGRSRTDDGYGKYKIYDNHEWRVFHLPPRAQLQKREIIWNYDRVFKEVYGKPRTPVVVVEGFKSVMWLHQNGFPHVVAVLGSFLSHEQLWLLEHLGQPVVLMFDNDAAGNKGLTYSVDRLGKSLQTFVAEFDSDFHQPTDLPPHFLQEVLQDPPNWASWAIQRSIHGIR